MLYIIHAMLYNYTYTVISISKEVIGFAAGYHNGGSEHRRKMNLRREQTATECRQKLLTAQRNAERLREQARTEAEAEVREMMSEAERQAAQQTYKALEAASAQWEQKKQEARKRVPQAAGWIVEKVVER